MLNTFFDPGPKNCAEWAPNQGDYAQQIGLSPQSFGGYSMPDPNVLMSQRELCKTMLIKLETLEYFEAQIFCYNLIHFLTPLCCLSAVIHKLND